VKRGLGDGFELDDDRARIDIDGVFDFLSNDAYWADGRPRELVERTIREAQRVVGLYHNGRQIGFTRTFSDGASVAYLADVYLLPEYRGRGLGVELVRETVEAGPYKDTRWPLHTRDATCNSDA
jgi:GNAT superfamily N-acetyltransferase